MEEDQQISCDTVGAWDYVRCVLSFLHGVSHDWLMHETDLVLLNV